MPSKPVDILSEAAMRNAYYTCHNVQVIYHAWWVEIVWVCVDGRLSSLRTDRWKVIFRICSSAEAFLGTPRPVRWIGSWGSWWLRWRIRPRSSIPPSQYLQRQLVAERRSLTSIKVTRRWSVVTWWWRLWRQRRRYLCWGRGMVDGNQGGEWADQKLLEASLWILSPSRSCHLPELPRLNND